MRSTVLITGCSRGIGLELARQYLEAGWQVIATARDISQAPALSSLMQGYENLELFSLNVACDESIATLKQALAERPVDLLINNAGIYGAANSVTNLSREAWRDVLEISTISPLMLTQALLPNLQAGQLKVIAMMSSKVGSVADNQSGGSYYYRTSKTALNQVVKSLSVDLAALGFKVVALHPGWVLTDMGGPNALIGAKTSARGLRQVLEGLDASESGHFLSYDGQSIPW